MSPDRLSEMDELDALGAELAEAGRIARVAVTPRSRPDPVFTMRLRAGLLDAFGSSLMVPADDAEAPNLVEPMPRHLEVSSPRAEEVAASLAPLAAASAETPEPIDRARRTGSLGPAFFTRLGRSVRPRSGETSAAAPELIRGLEEGTGSASTGAPTRLRPAIRWRVRGQAMPSRWVGLGVAASLIVGLLAAGSFLLRPVEAPARADAALAATLLRNGSSTELTPGTTLLQGDEIRVAQGGLAYLTLASNHVRLDAGADLRLDSLEPTAIEVDQLAGRVYHRVLLPSGGTYSVLTGDVAWKAMGTAFDLDRRATSAGEEVLGLALQHDLQVAAPGYYGNVPQGSSAVFTLDASGAAAGAPSTSSIALQSLANPWLVENAQLDSRLGLPLGELAEVLNATPTPSESATPTPSPSAHETAAATEPPAAGTPAPTPAPTKTPQPTPTPTPKPAGIASLGSLSITHKANGSYSFSWPEYKGHGFQYYKIVYGPWGTSPTFNGSNYWACNTSPGDTTWTGFVTPGDYAVRVQVVDESSGKIVIRAQTQVARLTASLAVTKDLGNLNYHDNGDGTYTFWWTGYSELPFSYYKLVFGPYPSEPSYVTGSDYWAVPGSGSSSVTLTVGTNNGGSKKFQPGDWSVRIQAIGYPYGSAYVYAQTNLLHLTVAPPATPTPEPTPSPTPEPTPEPTPSLTAEPTPTA
jgi:hypothetical protein